VLILAGTPIGNSLYASEALCEALRSADVIAAEDTRVLRTLLLRIGVEVSAEVVSYFEGNEATRTPQLVQRMLQGARLVLVTDAGMPSVSDPGYRLVRGAIDAGVQVSCVPGPSAVLTALAVSGLTADKFCFEGFLPRKAGERAGRFTELVNERRTMVFFEAPHRLAVFLAASIVAFGEERQAAVCRELTKPYEEVIRGTLAELLQWTSGEVRGEIVVVIAGAQTPTVDLLGALALVRERMSTGELFSVAVSEVAVLTGIRRRELYAAALEEKISVQ
jgi:16S rRNA (cytidine1402-2'-O)-methyltransferase